MPSTCAGTFVPYRYERVLESGKGKGLSIRIVIVDDHASLRQSVCSLLRQESDMEVVAEAEIRNGLLVDQLNELQAQAARNVSSIAHLQN